jgi:hypothetical protein
MPLKRTTDQGEPNEARLAIGFWMGAEDADGDDRIRVFVTFEALRKLDPTSVPDLSGAIEVFAKYRLPIEEVASDKYDAEGVDEGTYEGCPILFVRSDDLP